MWRFLCVTWFLNSKTNTKPNKDTNTITIEIQIQLRICGFLFIFLIHALSHFHFPPRLASFESGWRYEALHQHKREKILYVSETRTQFFFTFWHPCVYTVYIFIWHRHVCEWPQYYGGGQFEMFQKVVSIIFGRLCQ